MKKRLQKLLHRVVRFANAYHPPNPYLADGTLTVGDHTYGLPIIRKHRGDRQRVYIGKFCSIADQVTIFVGGNHNIQWVSTYPFRAMFHLPGALQDGHPSSRGDVVIGSDVWLGYGVTVLSGVQIGHGAVIGARAVVTHDIPAYHVAAGNPAHIIRPRFSPEQIQALLDIAWWNWPLERILTMVPQLNQGDVDGFIAAAPGQQAETQD